jgi:hypothetical protein
MSRPPLIRAAWPRVRAAWPLWLVLALWNAYQVGRLGEPMKIGPEAWIGRQIGRTGLNHLRLGLGTTKGTEVNTVWSDGRLELHPAYSPLASWTVAAPLALGVPFHLAVRLPVLVSFNLFLVGLWSLARCCWGARVALLALIFAALAPGVLFRYSLACIYEFLALGPLLCSLALLARPRRGRAADALAVVSAAAAVLYSWICWLAVVPGIGREWIQGRRRMAVALVLAAVVFPTALHFTLAGLASGGLIALIGDFFGHIAERASTEIPQSGRAVTQTEIVQAMFTRWIRTIGWIPLAGTLAGLAVMRRARPAGWGWPVALLVMALPLNLVGNIAYLHPFFIILFVPAASLLTALTADRMARALKNSRLQVAALALLLMGFFALDVLPRRKASRPTAEDAEQSAIADAIGSTVRPGDLVIVNPIVCGLKGPAAASLGEDRERTPRPYYCGQMSQSVLVALDTTDAERLADRARPDQRVVILEVGQPAWDLPASFARIEAPARSLVIGVRSDGLARHRDMTSRR